MRIGYFIRNVGVSGGVKVILQHVMMLKEAGFDVALMAEKVKAEWQGLPSQPIPIKEKDLSDMPLCDVYVGSVPTDVVRLHKRKKGIVVHLCQGYEPVEYRSRIDGEAISEKYMRKGPFSAFQRCMDTAKFKKRIRDLEAIYRLPTVKAAVSRHLKELIEKTYSQECALIQNGIDAAVFYPQPDRVWGGGGTVKVLSVGSMAVGFKGIADTLDAVQSLKEQGMAITLIRVSPGPPSTREKEGGIVDRYLTSISEAEMAALYREADIFISSSLEGEGFGLPAIEALASGAPAILTEISTYRNFSGDKTFAWFVPTHSPERISAGIIALKEDAGLRQRCIENGLLVARRYTLEQTKEDLITFMEGLERCRN